MNVNFYILFLIYFHILKSFGQINNNNTSTLIHDAQDKVKQVIPLSIKQGNSDAKNATGEKILPSKVDSLKNDSFNNSTTSVLINNLNTDAVFRGFYVVLGIGSLFLIYIAIKTFRLKRHRASNRYKVIATKNEDRESFFPLAADEGEDEEIFSAATSQGSYS